MSFSIISVAAKTKEFAFVVNMHTVLNLRVGISGETSQLITSVIMIEQAHVQIHKAQTKS